MNDEIKEILEDLRNKNMSVDDLTHNDKTKLLDYITNLQEEKDKEIERLNNVIDKLEEYLNKIIDTSAECERITCKFVLQYLQELKGSDE